ncbi:glycoside hydrolase family 108 protein [Neorhizobium sp. JUb45]|uniref:glycoside hydrolase family 108 protein n=1 Tax=Neorhizobium sp. JUb45 TaxID=2485113 RepID=UPI001042A319|nr:glycoside hydrolase family 108 protein [Neorhizobium sp. JUb45]TCR01054.1 lysozyme family protein [Neorhizobium sp. JUb45]
MTVQPAQSEFVRSLAKVLVHEGGYSNHPADPGGATMKGVTQRVYDDYREALNLKPSAVRNISETELQAIYRRRYWDLAKCDRLAPGVSYVVFDGAVNSGVAQSAKWLQRALAGMGLYKGTIDGVVGDGTILAASQVNDNDALVGKICELRLAFLKQLKTWKTFGKGWSARVAGVRKVGQAWASGSIGPEVTYVAGGEARAMLSDAKPAPKLAVADAATGAGGGSFGIAGVLKTAQEQLMPFAGTSQFINQAVAVLVVGGVVITVGGLGYRWYAQRRKAERAEALDIETAPAVVEG